MLVTLSGDSNAGQATAVSEGLLPNAGDALGDSNAGQATAVIECPPLNAGDAVANRHAR